MQTSWRLVHWAFETDGPMRDGSVTCTCGAWMRRVSPCFADFFPEGISRTSHEHEAALKLSESEHVRLREMQVLR